MTDEELPAVAGWSSIFPFVMVLSANLVTGLAFVALNVPLLRQLVAGPSGVSAGDVLARVEGFWTGVMPAEIGIGLVILAVLCVLTVGLVVQPVAVVFVTLTGWLAKHTFRGYTPYLPPVFFGESYVKFADWIHRHRAERVHYEWELFNHYLYAGIAFNVLIAVSAAWALIRPGTWPSVGLGALGVLATGYSLARGAVLSQVFSLYSDRARFETDKVAADTSAAPAVTPNQPPQPAAGGGVV
jgi:hypothetical protein